MNEIRGDNSVRPRVVGGDLDRINKREENHNRVHATQSKNIG